MIGKLGLSVAALALTASPVASQQHQHEDRGVESGDVGAGMDGCMMMGGMGQMMGMMSAGENGAGVMMRAMSFVPAVVLGHREALELTPDQVARIGAIESGTSSAHEMTGMSHDKMAPMAGMSAQQLRLGAAFDKSPVDSEAIQATSAELGAAHAAMMAGHLVTAAKVRDILSPSQRARVAELMADCMKDGPGMMSEKVEHEGTTGAATGH